MLADVVVDPSMRTYYDRRAPEYDDWWLGAGLFAKRERPGWEAEVRALIDAVASLPEGRVLDVACGTAFLTRHLPGEVTAIDQSPAMVAVAAERLPHARVLQGDAVPLPFEDGAFDILFTSHFYGHLLPDERERFLAEARRVAGRVVIADSALRPGEPPEDWQERKLNDGSRHRVYKRWFTAEQLAEELGGGEALYAGRWFTMVASP